jgi:hypothetical protein
MTTSNRHFKDADTAIMIVIAGSPLCVSMLKTMRSPGTLSSGASSTFEAAWRIYKETYAANGGVFGVLIHGRLRAVGPVVVMGLCAEVATVAEMLSLKAREITHATVTPIMADPALQPAVNAVIARLTHVEGHA